MSPKMNYELWKEQNTCTLKSLGDSTLQFQSSFWEEEVIRIRERKRALLLVLAVLMKADVECVLSVSMLTENVLSACLFEKTTFQSKWDFSREMISCKHTLVFLNMKKNSVFTAHRHYPCSTILCPLTVGLTEAPELGFLLQPVPWLYFSV